ncbi:EpsG family protein [Garciella nitratireducens]|uniref:EpsG family protein n=1 Tax=Garciella nitratireducens TaxID=218205 RepID=UPI001BD40BFC|nr:EpsG family protein [Garciella nitratireducens]
MLIYFCVLLIVYCLALIIQFKKLSKKWTILDIFILLIIIIFSSIRYKVGTDYELYFYTYNYRVSNIFNLNDFYTTSQEFGYYLISWITKKISSSPYAIFWTSAIITYIPIYSRLKKETSNFSLAILLFFLLGFYATSFNIIRQSIAIAINFYANQYINTERKKFILLNIVGASFHLSCIIVMIIQLIINRIKPTKKFFLFTVVLAILSVIWIEKFALIFNFIENINPRYLTYFNIHPAGIGLKLLTLLRFIITIYVFLVTNKNEYHYYKVSLIVSLLFMIMGWYNVFLGRIEIYFSITLLLLLPEILRKIEIKERILHQYCLNVVFLIVFILSLIYFGDLVPYKTYLM